MKVKDLIALLQKYNPEDLVILEDDYGESMDFPSEVYEPSTKDGVVAFDIGGDFNPE